MIEIILIMAAGIAVGYAIRVKRLVKVVDRLTMYSICLLLFLLGVAIGVNELIVKNMHILGLRAFVLSLGGVMGSVFLSWIAYNLWFKPKSTKNEE